VAAPGVIEKMIIVLGRVEINGGRQANECTRDGGYNGARNDAPMTKGERNLSIKPSTNPTMPTTCLSVEIKIVK